MALLLQWLPSSPKLAVDGARALFTPVLWMSLLSIDKAQLDLRAVDEEESEAVALCLIEYIFAEANAHYHQHRLSEDAIQTTAALLTASVLDALSGAMLTAEEVVEPSRFTSDPMPDPDANDRHAARCLPHRSLELGGRNGNGSPTLADSHTPERSRASVVRKRRKKTDKASPVKAPLVAIPQVILMPDTNGNESEEDRAWRLKCLKELNGEPQGKCKPGTLSKWAIFARRTPIVEPRISMEVEVIDSVTPVARHEIQGANGAASIRMKSSLHTFSSVLTPRLRQPSLVSAAQARRTSTRLTVSQSEPLLLTPQRKASGVQLNDELSRKRATASGSSSAYHNHGNLHHPHSHDVNPWVFEADDSPAEGESPTREPFVPDMMVASAASIATIISLAAGVEMAHAEGTMKGPERRDSSHTMSRKRFELHQRLATDHLLQEQALMQQRASASSPSTSKSTSPQSRLSPRPYETVSPDPIPVPSLSPIAKNALVIPRNHLLQSASTPSLRIRNAGVMKRSEGSTGDVTRNGGLVTAEEIDAVRNVRPSFALGAVSPRKMMPIHQHSDVRPKTSSGAPSSPAQSPTYLREFPKPHAGTIKLNARKAMAESADASDSARQRLAWIS